MATEAQIAKSKKVPKFSTRKSNRCFECGRKRAFMRDFGLCRICFKEKAAAGFIPGVRRSSW